MSIVEVAAARAAPYAAEHVDALLEDCKEHYAEAYEASYGANRERAREARRARLAHRAGMAALRAFFALGDDAGESAQAVVEAYLKERIVALLDALIHTEIKPPMRAQVVKRVWWVACVPCARFLRDDPYLGLSGAARLNAEGGFVPTAVSPPPPPPAAGRPRLLCYV